MNTEMIAKLLSLVASFIPYVKEASQVVSVISTLKELISEGSALASDLKEPVTNIINALRSNENITPEQLAELDALEKLADEQFDAAANASGV